MEKRPGSNWARGALCLAALLLPACASGGPDDSSEERTGEARSAAFGNGDFETPANAPANTVPPAPWTVTTHLNSTGITVQTPQTLAGLNLAAGGTGKTFILHTNAGPGTQIDPDLGATASLRWPRYGNQCVIVNQHGNNKNVNELSQTMTIGAGDVDPSDNQVHVRFTVAPVLQNPAHTATQQPYYFVQLTNVTQGNAILYSDFNLSGAGIPWKTVGTGANEIDYTDWQLVDIAPGASKIAMGDTIKLQIIAAGCQPSAHWGEIYVDGIGPTVPGLSVQGTGPAQANAGSDVTYNFTYKNGSAKTACTTPANCSPNTEACVGGFCAETVVVIDFTTPPNTTFQSITPPAGAVCTTLPVGGTGTITCTFTNPVGPGATGTFAVTVNINGGTTGQITCANYDIHSTQETTLVGTKIVTNVGCAKDSDCAAPTWCNETAKACKPTLANGTSIPSDPPHTAPTLNGTCTVAASTLVCTSAVCDTTDNKCGYLNGDGPCTVANGGTVCRSAVCDGKDLKCGYANGDGPCTAVNAGTVCRSGACSVNGLCEPAGGCNVDADCTAGNWCNESTHVCTAKLSNGTAIPSDPPHTPALNGTCTLAAGALVCTSAVCDTSDNRCGYANGDGPCTLVNGGTVCRSTVCDPDLKCGYANGDGPCTAGTMCRSGICSANNLCAPAGGCNVDADCAAGTWCNESAHLCAPKLSNGTAIPSDPPHTAPTLNGTCTTAASTLVCTSAVCDTLDNKCGYFNGDGPCTVANGPVVCRSTVCDGKDLKCGYAVGDGPCTAATAGTVCRSGACSVNLTCEPAGGCNVDGDCAAGNWCQESTHTCTPKLTNGTAMPSDPPHTGPTLNGTCTAVAADLVCQSGVCDTNDDKCGYAVNDGPCTVATGGVVCRSGACSVNGLCEPLGGCNVDGDCGGGDWCLESTHTCTAKLGNGTALPNDPPHTGPTLSGACTTAAAILVCQSAVCDTDDRCGYLNGDGPCTVANGGVVCRSGVCDGNDLACGYAVGDGPCTAANAGTVCRSGACSVNGLCEPLGGCNVDADCVEGNWCNEGMHACTPQLPNGQAVPNDPPHVGPTLDGTCSTAAGALTCVSGVCDTADNLCGYAVGDGPCTVANGPSVCRSGACSVNGLCEPAGGCNVDADCAGGTWCMESTHTCTPQLANGTSMPTDGPHTSPTLDGTCTLAAGTLVCVSGVCDTADSKCGYANGDGPCNAASAGLVCRSGACSVNGLCEPSGGCNVDADCAAGSWCMESTNTCTPQLANGAPVPTDGPHTNPTLDGTCSPEAGALTCQSGVCDTADDACGYADGDGPCTAANGPVVCRSGACSVSGTCEPSGGCNVDADCAAGNWCNESMHACTPQLPNGQAVPNDPPHVGPTLDGSCTAAAGTLTCASGVCDTKDNLCGYANGDGPCDGANGDVVCRSQKCGPMGVCVGCAMDSDCSGTTPVCNTATGICVQCTASSQCSGATPICDTTSSACVPCNGDEGTAATHPCPMSAPFCFLSGSMAGQCGECATDADCQGHTGNVCDSTSGLCKNGCHVDADCMPTDWCDSADGTALGMCQPKLDNGKPLPSMPGTVAKCTDAVGKRVCKSGVCDPKDDACGLADGDGPCSDPEVCRTDACDTASMTCGKPVVECAKDADCKAAEYCAGDGTCQPKKPDGQTCGGDDECQSNACHAKRCDSVIAQGGGCATRPDRSDDGSGAALVGLMLAAAGLARRRRR